MKPHCILGSSSALFLSIMGYKTEVKGGRKVMGEAVAHTENTGVEQWNWTWLHDTGKWVLQWALGPVPSSQGLLAPRIQLQP